MNLSDIRDRLAKARNDVVTLPPQHLQAPTPPEEKKKKKVAWEYEGDYPPDIPKLVESLNQPKSEVNYFSKKAMRNLNHFIQGYGDFLVETKYSVM